QFAGFAASTDSSPPRRTKVHRTDLCPGGLRLWTRPAEARLKPALPRASAAKCPKSRADFAGSTGHEKRWPIVQESRSLQVAIYNLKIDEIRQLCAGPGLC